MATFRGLVSSLVRTLRPRRFEGSEAYWRARYEQGGNSGVGSYGVFAEFKAEVLNGFVAERGIATVIEFGSGDGNQLSLATYPRYAGYDVSDAAIAACRARFASDPTRTFAPMSAYAGETAELALSLDVIYHLVEDAVFERYMRTLFAAATKHVAIYASDTDEDRGDGAHVRHRTFTAWIARELPGWKLVRHLPNRYPYKGDYKTGCFSDFYFFEPVAPADRPPPSAG